MKIDFLTQDLLGWFRDDIVLGPSKIHGQGLFTKTDVFPGEIVMRWAGRFFQTTKHTDTNFIGKTIIDISESCIVAQWVSESCTLDDFLNHSCDSNLWMIDALTVAARRKIFAGEELTLDYATWLGDESFVFENCGCRENCCRKRITGNDWKNPTVQRQYTGHFSPFLLRRISKENEIEAEKFT